MHSGKKSDLDTRVIEFYGLLLYSVVLKIEDQYLNKTIPPSNVLSSGIIVILDRSLS